jgi:hypothetical protein
MFWIYGWVWGLRFGEKIGLIFGKLKTDLDKRKDIYGRMYRRFPRNGLSRDLTTHHGTMANWLARLAWFLMMIVFLVSFLSMSRSSA